MTQYDSTTARVPATARTWEVVTTYRECSVVTGHSTSIVSLTRTPFGLLAQIDGEDVELRRAVNLLEGATSTRVIHEIIPTPDGIKAHTQAVWG
ncbi:MULTISPECIES: hypothetical protein [Deinococcus]|uniref:Uncharacterized protein n=1 Tax=Deinococcus rufus TaxID=2136097 RepID=A0ABV7ZA16_9DEIO|nr:hypothetical protein [Deinococcus sp. AB2017081]WQE97458.1 hypothetical protein U2P90_20090 [Deinococcus sp. AB2017081]WQE97481.1 hypothetical protein U2P90_19960 [Deinococcus sp. AB2017081]